MSGARIADAGVLPPEVILAAYLENYARRRSAGTGTTFPSPEANAVLAVAEATLGARYTSQVATQLASVQLRGHAQDALMADDPRVAVDIAGFALASDPSAEVGLSLESRQAVLAAFDETLLTRPNGPVWAGWRRRFLLAARPVLDGGRQALSDEHTMRLSDQLRGRLQALIGAPENLSVASRVAWLAAGPDGEASDALTEEAGRLVDALIERHDLMTADGSRVDSPRTIELVWFALAAQTTGHTRAAQAVLSWLCSRRVEAGRKLLLSGDGTSDRYELSPWVVLALAASPATSLDAIEQALDPQTPELPVFELDPRSAPIQPSSASEGSAVVIPAASNDDAYLGLVKKAPPQPGFELTVTSSGADRISYSLDVDGLSFVRDVDAAELNLLVRTTLRTLYDGIDDDGTAARVLGEQAIALLALLERGDDDFTRGTIEQLIEASVAGILASQSSAGGWASSGRERGIDTAVCGVALVLEHARTGNRRCLESALRAAAFFERRLGRVGFGARRVWLHFVGDRDTPRYGSAVDHELWAGYFFACVSTVAPDDVRGRAVAYAHESVDYAAEHIGGFEHTAAHGGAPGAGPSDAATSSWLLSEICAHAAIEPASMLARAVADRLSTLVLANGMLPGTIAPDERPGERIAPYPVTTRGQLQFVIAAAVAGSGLAGARRALGYVLIDLWDEAFSSLGSGYDGRGRFADLPESGRDGTPLLHAVGLLHRLGEFDYRPAISDVRSAEDRLLSAIRRCWHGVNTRSRVPLDELSTGALADRIQGTASMFRQLRDEVWLDETVAGAQSLVYRRRQIGWGDEPTDSPNVVATSRAGIALLDAYEVVQLEPLHDSALGAVELVAGALEHARRSMRPVAIAWSISLLARQAAVPAERGELLASGLERLLSMRHVLGLWPVGTRRAALNSSSIDVLAALFGIAWEWPDGELERTLREGVESHWATLFATSGRRWHTPRHDAPMATGQAATFARICCDGALRLSDVSMLDRGRAIVRYLFHNDRTPDGDFLISRIGGGTETGNSLRCFAELARIREHAPDVAGEQPVLAAGSRSSW